MRRRGALQRLPHVTVHLLVLTKTQASAQVFVLQKGEGASYLGLFLQQSLGGVAPAALGGGLHRSLLGVLQRSRAAQV